MSNELSTLRSSTATIVSEAKKLKTQLATLGATVSITELRDNVANLEKQKGELTERVEGLRAVATSQQIKHEEDVGCEGDARVSTKNNVPTAKGNEKKMVEEEIKTFTTILVRRKKIAIELWDIVKDMMPPKVKNEEEWKVSPFPPPKSYSLYKHGLRLF